jgi:tetratricopeptide (TPR) repeat protein
LLKQRRYEQALFFFRRVLKHNPDSIEALVKTGVALNLMEEYQRAEMFLKDAHIRAPKDSAALLWLVATNLAMADTADADRYLNKLIASFPLNQLKTILNRISDPDAVISSRGKLLNPVINGKLREKFEALALPEDHRTGYAMNSDFSETDGSRQDPVAIKP